MHRLFALTAVAALATVLAGPAPAEDKGGIAGLTEGNAARLDFIESSTPGGVSGCAEGQIAKYVAGAWQCANDTDTVGTDTNAATICGPGTVLTGDGECLPYPLPRNVIVVPGDGTPFANGTALLAALANLATATPPPSEDLPYMVRLGPGVFHLNFDSISLPAHVTLAGSGRGLTRIVGHPQSDPLVTLADRTALMQLSLENTACETFIGGDYEAVRIPSASDRASVALRDVEIGADTGFYIPPEPPGMPGTLCTTFGLIFGNAWVTMEDSRISAGNAVIVQSYAGALIAERSTIVADPRSHSSGFVAISAGSGGFVSLRNSSVSDDIYANASGIILARVELLYSRQEVGSRLGSAIYSCAYSYDVKVGGVTEFLDENCAPVP